jgi:hypothetical protein
MVHVVDIMSGRRFDLGWPDLDPLVGMDAGKFGGMERARISPGAHCRGR